MLSSLSCPMYNYLFIFPSFCLIKYFIGIYSIQCRMPASFSFFPVYLLLLPFLFFSLYFFILCMGLPLLLLLQKEQNNHQKLFYSFFLHNLFISSLFYPFTIISLIFIQQYFAYISVCMYVHTQGAFIASNPLLLSTFIDCLFL